MLVGLGHPPVDEDPHGAQVVGVDDVGIGPEGTEEDNEVRVGCREELHPTRLAGLVRTGDVEDRLVEVESGVQSDYSVQLKQAKQQVK